MRGCCRPALAMSSCTTAGSPFRGGPFCTTTPPGVSMLDSSVKTPCPRWPASVWYGVVHGSSDIDSGGKRAMFRPRVPQGSLLESEFLVPPAKAKRLQKTWAEEVRSQALPLIDEKPFAHMYCEDDGRPNRAVQTLLGVLVLKKFGDLTDGEALEQLEFNLLWHYALQLTADESHLPQKTLHNFRARKLRSEE